MTSPPPPPLSFSFQQLLALYEVGKLVHASLDLDRTLAAIAEAACELTGAEQSAILLLDDDRDHLVRRVGRGSACGTAIGERIPASAGLTGRALRDRTAVLVPDGCPAIVAPLVWNAETLGVVLVASTAPAALGPAEAALVQELADHAAAAVARARAYATERAQRLESEALNRQLADRTHQLERLQHQLVQNEKLTAIGQLAHGIAHELNTPLGVIVSNLSVLQQYGTALADFSRTGREAIARLQREDGPSRLAEALHSAAQAADLAYILEDLPNLTAESTASADRIATIVRSVATFARRGPDSLAAVNVEEALEAAITLAWSELKHRGEVVRDFAGVPPVTGQVSELAQVFVHVLLNAAHALPHRHGRITLRTSSDGQQVSIAITDNGCGIPAQHLPRVFDPFFTTRGPGHGTGMGLAVCHGIVTRFGGTIDLDSEPGRGTTLTVRLPLATPLGVAA